ncbi:hypothetical protein FE697_007225 [Mumia zhuanghuii]|uniref:Uncharacterized protein n=2 Tax=Mumia TaxID=1546255 RepID=A0ABW1QLX3_9ACTN|nr:MULTISPECIES: hypothetical protein [Mumia]KAA1423395.1 hypothetical protein FE697_007225 [Mumia zhuanghuii]
MSDDTVEAARAIIEKVELDSVYLIEFSARRWSNADIDGYELKLDTRYRLEPEQIDYLFDALCVVKDEDGDDIAEIKASVVTAHSASEDAQYFPIDSITGFGQEVALYAAYPYIRETVQAAASRLGLPSLTLKMLKRNGPPPFTQTEDEEEEHA